MGRSVLQEGFEIGVEGENLTPNQRLGSCPVEKGERGKIVLLLCQENVSRETGGPSRSGYFSLE